jgi:hypothetical protein
VYRLYKVCVIGRTCTNHRNVFGIGSNDSSNVDSVLDSCVGFWDYVFV